jgi:GT2 family glycosyltransferase
VAEPVPRPKVFAVVLNWNRTADTLACLDSLAQSTYDDLHVIVVDNGSRFSCRPDVEKSHPWVEVIENERNLGYSGGNNVGIRRALEGGAAYVWVLNNDTVVDPDAIARLVECAERHPHAAAAGGRVLRADRPDVLWMTWGRVTWRQSLIALEGQDEPDSARFDGERAVEWIPGCSILFRADALRDVGLFDEDFFAYHEDVDWAARARERGWEIWYTGGSRIRHAIHASSGGEEASFTGFRSYLSARNSVLYARRHGGAAERALLAAAIVATLPFQWIRRLARGQQQGVRMKLRGWRDGLTGRAVPFDELGLR